MDDLLYKHLIQTGLYEPNTDFDAAILENDALLSEIAAIWQGHEGTIKAIVQARLQPIREELVMNAHPASVLILREVMLELSALYQDFERYTAEYERRKKDKEQGPPVTIESSASTSPSL